MQNESKISRQTQSDNPLKNLWDSFWDGLFIKGRLDLPLLVFTVIIACIGLVMLLSASYPESYRDNQNGYEYFKMQAIFMVIGGAIMLFASKVNYDKLRMFAVPFWVLSLLLVVAAIVVGITDENDGGINRRLGFFQPSEITKFAVILLCANGLSFKHKKMLSKKPSKGMISAIIAVITKDKIKITESTATTIQYGLLVALSALIVFLGSHLSGAIIITAIGIFMLWLGEADKKWFIAGAVVVAILLVIVINFYEDLPIPDYMITRLRTFFGDDGDRWQTDNGLYALGSGGLFGLGIDGSKQKYAFVSEPHTDFIFTIVGEELGFIGCMIIIVLYGALIGRGMYVAYKAKNRFGTLLGMGIMVHIGLQVVINLAVITDLIPNTGISLPLFSYGGTAVVMTLAEIGVLLGISRQADLPKVYSLKNEQPKKKTNRK